MTTPTDNAPSLGGKGQDDSPEISGARPVPCPKCRQPLRRAKFRFAFDWYEHEYPGWKCDHCGMAYEEQGGGLQLVIGEIED